MDPTDASTVSIATRTTTSYALTFASWKETEKWDGRSMGKKAFRAIYALQGMSEPRGRLAQCSVNLRAVLAASLGAHRKAQHARVCFAGGRYFSRQRQLRECRCSARSAKRLAESTLGNCMLGVWLCPSRSRAPGGTRGGTGCKGAHHRSRYSPFRHWLKTAKPLTQQTHTERLCRASSSKIFLTNY